MPRKFLADAMLGKLSRYLRMMGYDTEYVEDGGSESEKKEDYEVENQEESNDKLEDEEIAEKAREEERVILTRDVRLAALVEESVLIESHSIEDQLREFSDAGYDLSLEEPDRCSTCNGKLEETDSKPDHAPDSIDEIRRCVRCGKHYWKGSHWDDVRQTLEDVRRDRE